MCCSGILLVAYFVVGNKSKRRYREIADSLRDFISQTEKLYLKGTYKVRFDSSLDELYASIKELHSFALRYAKSSASSEDEKQLCQAFVKRVEDYPIAKKHYIAIYETYQYIMLHIESARSSFNRYIADDHYITHSEQEYYRRTYQELYTKASFFYENAYSAELTDVELKERTLIYNFISRFGKLDDTIQKHNANFEQKQLVNHKVFFDTVLAYPLDAQQKHAVLSLEDNTLVASAAGSGKTSTMVAKIKYLITCLDYNPENILVLTYTRKAAEELTQRLGYGDKLYCSTFHSLALKIIGEATGKRPAIADEKTIQLTYQQLRKTDAYTQSIIEYLEDFTNGIQYEYDYDIQSDDEYKKMTDELRQQQYVPDRTGRFPAIKSMQEFEICKYLFNNGIEYEYECAYEYSTADETHREYLPDFSIFYEVDGVKKRIYLEHFGIDRNGKVAKFFGDDTYSYEEANQAYNDGIVWKRQLHQEHNTILIETTSAMFQDYTWKNKLEEQLKQHAVPFKPRQLKEISEKTADELEMQDESFVKLIEAFISLMKSNLYTLDIVEEKILSEIFTRKTYKTLALFQNIIRPVVVEYTQRLKESAQIDFIDAIIMATDFVRKKMYKNKIDYILVDEFQDISKDRYELIQALRTDFPCTKLFCVGDDWQSIYRFAGSQLDFFTRFQDYFGYTDECYIEQTYRYNDPILSLASKFVLRNPNQKKKNVRNPLKEKAAPTNIHFYPFANPKQQADEIIRIVNSYPEDEKVAILGRYSYSWMFLKNIQFEKNKVVLHVDKEQKGKVTIEINGRKCRYLTAHSSKGLEADHVIIINCNAGEQGFPSEIVDSPVLQYVLNEGDDFPYSEERRLWYVAITRAKKNLHVLYNRSMPSAFITELYEILHPKPKLKPKVDNKEWNPFKLTKIQPKQHNNDTKVVAIIDADQILEIKYFKRGSTRYIIRLKTGTIVQAWGSQSLTSASQYKIIALKNGGKENWVLCNVSNN